MPQCYPTALRSAVGSRRSLLAACRTLYGCLSLSLHAGGGEARDGAAAHRASGEDAGSHGTTQRPKKLARNQTSKQTYRSTRAGRQTDRQRNERTNERTNEPTKHGAALLPRSGLDRQLPSHTVLVQAAKAVVRSIRLPRRRSRSCERSTSGSSALSGARMTRAPRRMRGGAGPSSPTWRSARASSERPTAWGSHHTRARARSLASSVTAKRCSEPPSLVAACGMAARCMLRVASRGRFHDALTARMDEAEQQRQRLASDCAAQMKQTRQALLASHRSNNGGSIENHFVRQ